jgi:GNAT superfamily N-acetyltransferase
MESLVIRPLQAQDIPVIVAAFAAVGWSGKDTAQYERYLALQEQGQRPILTAWWNGVFAGYGCLVWQPEYPPYREADIPEIQDLNVLPDFRRRGIASRIMDEAERIAAECGYTAIGIGFGMTADYGAAQQLYVRRGYVPDGRGLHYENRPLQNGDTVTVNDDLVLYLTKTLSTSEEEETKSWAN